VDPADGLDGFAEKQFLAASGLRTPDSSNQGLVTIPTELSLPINCFRYLPLDTAYMFILFVYVTLYTGMGTSMGTLSICCCLSKREIFICINVQGVESVLT
jgi:hypothetical protein